MSATRRPRFADEDGGDDSRPHRSHPPPTPSQPEDDDARPAPNPRRRSILRDPNSEGSKQRRRSPSNSRVRVKPPPTDYHSSDDEGTVKGNYVRHRNGQVEFVPDEPRRRKHDLERKNGETDKRFRERRDGYESDEGEQLRRSKKKDPRTKDNIGDVDDDDTMIERPKGRSAWDAQQVRSRNGNSREGAFVVPDRTRARDDRDDKAAVGRRRDIARKKYDSDGEDDDPRPRRRPQPRRNPESRHERGYDSESPSRKRADWDGDDRYGDRRRSDRYDDGHAPRRNDPRDRRQSLPRQSRNDDDPYDRRDRRRDDPPNIRRARSDAKGRGRDGDRRGGEQKKVWMDQAGTLFMTHAMPVIKREGGRWARSQLEAYVGQRR